MGVEVAFTTSEPLAFAPEVVLDPGGVDKPLAVDAALSNAAATHWVFAVTLDGNEPEGTLEIHFRLVDRAGNESKQTAGALVVDFTPPEVSGFGWLDAKNAVKADAVIQPTANVEAPAEIVAALLVDQDGAQLAPLPAVLAATIDPTVLALQGLVDLTVVATGDATAIAARLEIVDEVGNTVEVESESLVFDSVAPSARIVAPVSPATVTTIDLDVSFNSPAGDAARFVCKLDSAPEVSCSSPHRLLDLAVGGHSFTVRAIDYAGNEGPFTTPIAITVERRWTALAVRGPACGLSTDDRLWCWGPNDRGQLGLGGAQAGSTNGSPGQVSGRFTHVALGSAHACAVERDGSLWCWGRNDDGELGLGYGSTTVAQFAPSRVEDANDWVDVATGAYHSCGIRDEAGVGRTLWCWGHNSWGQLGLGSQEASTVPARVGGEADWVGVAASLTTTCGLRGTVGDAEAYCWGRNDSGRAGQVGGPASFTEPQPVDAGFRFRELTMGAQAVCGLTTTDLLRCWGNNLYLAISGGGPAAMSPFTVAGDVASASTDGRQLCLTTTSGVLMCKGHNINGQLGIGEVTNQKVTLQPIGAESSWATVSTGAEFVGAETTCALRQDGTAACWGSDALGKVGQGRVAQVTLAPSPVATATSWSTVAVGLEATCALDTGGALWWWGEASGGQPPSDAPRNTDHPVPSTFPMTLTALEAGRTGFCAIADTGRLWCWGKNDYGQLGRPIGGSTFSPGEVQVDAGGPPPTNEADWVEVAIDDRFACGIRDQAAIERTLWCWGDDLFGRLGNGADGSTTVATQIGSATDWERVTLGYNMACGIRNEGAAHTLWCWGEEVKAHDCIVDGVNVLTPQLVGGAADVWLDIAAGQQHTCALRDDGGSTSLWCWGGGEYGQLGNDATDDACPMVQAPGSKWVDVEAGTSRTCAIADDAGARTLWCWGSNLNEYLTLGTDDFRIPSPRQLGSAEDWQTVNLQRSDGVACGVRAGGLLFCWGRYQDGQIGDDLVWIESPVELPAP